MRFMLKVLMAVACACFLAGCVGTHYQTSTTVSYAVFQEDLMITTTVFSRN